MRIPVLKTYKIYIGGEFPRTESGRYYELKNKKGDLIANLCLSSRKDLRNAIVAARGVQHKWAGKTAYNKGQILYRIAEMLEGRKAQFVDELIQLGYSAKDAELEVLESVDRLIYYAGWSDKYTQLFSTVNPVAGPYFNFSKPEPTGVVVAQAPNNAPLSGLVSQIAPIIVGGNTCVVIADELSGTVAVSFAEVLHSSDVPGGVVNILTGKTEEILPHASKHMDVNAVWFTDLSKELAVSVETDAALNVKRIVNTNYKKWTKEDAQSPYLIQEFQEIKTTWHPIGM
ncbi:aldehyde dehydrogenase family protein [bacterium]|nr:MAG: aldehyde dehydrogenase family protein [bacterium]